MEDVVELIRAGAAFTVVDLETTGGSPRLDSITEIGAVRVVGGRVEREYCTLVDPGRPIGAFVSTLTGITDAMVAGRPSIDEVLPEFLEFAYDTVLVAHNAPFDVGFLRQAASAYELAWPHFTVLDTVMLARRVLTPGEVINCKLATLAAYFGVRAAPNHRALADAHATVEVLLQLVARHGRSGPVLWASRL